MLYRDNIYNSSGFCFCYQTTTSDACNQTFYDQ